MSKKKKKGSESGVDRSRLGKTSKNVILTRKEKRKEVRKDKKQKRHLFLQKKMGKAGDKKEMVQEQEEAKNKMAKGQKSQKDDLDDRKAKDAARLERLQKEQARQRKRRLLEANLEEDKTLRKLEKQLKMNKGKKKKAGLPKAFIDDGLDFLLDAYEEGGGGSKWDEEEEEMAGGSDDDDAPEVLGHGDDEASDEDNEPNEDEEEVAEGEGAEDEDDETCDTDDNAEQPKAEVAEEEEGDSSGEEDIYGKKKKKKKGDARGDASSTTKYIPPALRARMAAGGGDGESDAKRKEALARLQKKVKGLLNRLATSNLGGIARQIEDLYMSHSRNDMTECIFGLLSESLVLSPAKTPERLIMEHAVLVALLHANVGTEVGATVLQLAAKQFHQLYLQRDQEDKASESGKELENSLLLLAHLYNFKIVDCLILFDLLDMLVDTFRALDVELILVTLRTVGFGLRKDDPSKLKEIVVKIQRKCGETQHDLQGDSRVKFMLEVLMAIKNNNMKKIPNYDHEHQSFLQGSVKQWLRPGVSSSNPLKIPLKDLLEADVRGRWWIVSSAWAGKGGGGSSSNREGEKGGDEEQRVEAVLPKYSSQLLDLARKMRMNTDARKEIFCSLMSAEDYLDAFERLLKLPVKHRKEREVAFVLLDCCLQERDRFNPYYSQLTSKLAAYDRKYRMATQFALWDKIKEMSSSLQKFQRSHLAEFTARLIWDSALSLACLKVIEFGELDKVHIAFLSKVLTSLLVEGGRDEKAVKSLFQAVAEYPKLKPLREGLRLFMRQFLAKEEEEEEEEEVEGCTKVDEKTKILRQRVNVAETAMMMT